MDVAVGDNLLKLVYRHSISTCIPGLILCVFIGHFLWSNTANNGWIYWVAIVSIIQILRPLGLRWIINADSLSMNTRLVLAGINTAFFGVTIGSCVLFFPQLDFAQCLILTVTLVGSVGAGGIVNAGYGPLYLCFVLPVMLPLMAFWVMEPQSYLSNALAWSLVGMATLTILLLAVIGRHNFNTFSEFIKLSNKHSLLSAKLSDALQRAEQEQEHAVASSLSKTRFLAAASHDLRQPVHIISLFASSLEGSVEKDADKQTVKDLNQTVRSLSRQINELLDIAKLDADSLKPDLCKLELSRVVKLISEELKAEASMAGIDLVNEVDSGMFVLSDFTMLSQILRNVIGNAIKYTRKGSVVLSSHRDNTTVMLSICDTGIGMSEDEQKHIFEEFFQIDNRERNKDKGIGLGLSIVKRLARSLSHEVAISSRPGEGTCVTLSLNLHDQSNDIIHGSNDVEEQLKHRAAFDCWVHLIDDQPSVRRDTTSVLEQLECLVTSCASVQESLELLGSNQPDVILAGNGIQGNDSGVQALADIQSRYPESHMVIASQDGHHQFESVAMKTKVNILTKPVDRMQLEKMLSSVRNEQLVQSSCHDTA